MKINDRNSGNRYSKKDYFIESEELNSMQHRETFGIIRIQLDSQREVNKMQNLLRMRKVNLSE
jgi:hypothetical protein